MIPLEGAMNATTFSPFLTLPRRLCFFLSASIVVVAIVGFLSVQSVGRWVTSRTMETTSMSSK